jgi:hypothetical protein
MISPTEIEGRQLRWQDENTEWLIGMTMSSSLASGTCATCSFFNWFTTIAREPTFPKEERVESSSVPETGHRNEESAFRRTA